MSIVWLASYPKSGNTWLRAVLTSYLREDGALPSINALVGSRLADRRRLFDEYVGLSSSDLTPAEILDLRPLFHTLLAADLPRPTFVKVHEPCLDTAAGPLFPRAATAGVVCLVRNPLDVALSWAHHQRWSVARTLAELNRPAAVPPSRCTGIGPDLPESRLPWSAHVASWLESDLPVHVARYEDMISAPVETFGGIVRHAGLEWDSSRLARAVGRSRFDLLRAQEERLGFDERQPTAPSFFRSGTAGGWRAALTPAQVRSVVGAHGPVMERFGYLRDAEAFLADAEAPASSRASRQSGCPTARVHPVEGAADPRG